MQAPPNILWIITTQWRAQACGYAGDPNACTPSLDAFAAQAVNYVQAVTPHPFGPFARAALLTGAPSPENGVRNYFDPLPARARTVAHEMREQGYVTAFFGKWHLGPRDPAAALVSEAHARTLVPPEHRGGFEYWEGFESGFQLNDPWLHGTRLPEPTRFAGYQPAVLAGRVTQWWSRRSDGRPWFCVYSLENPHPPYDAAANGATPRNPAHIQLATNVPLGDAAEARARRELAGYYAHVEATDACIGELLRQLEARGGEENTIVVFTSVHGDMHGAHGLFRKGWPHEESVRVPLLVRYPSAWRRRAGVDGPHTRSELVSLLDLPRWTAGWAKTGRDYAPALGSSLQRISMPSVVPLPLQCDRVWRGVRTAARKLVLEADGAPWLFFDLERDPSETENLVGNEQRASEIGALRKLVNAA